MRRLKLEGQIISFVHIPNEGKRSEHMRKKMGREGLVRGASDYDIKLDWNLYIVASLALELKTIVGSLSAEQVRYLQDVDQPNKGHAARVIAARTGQECSDMILAELHSLKREKAL